MVLVQSLQLKGPELESTYILIFFFLYFTSLFDSFHFIIINVPRPLSNVFWIIIFKRLMRNAYTEPVYLEHLRASKWNSIRNKTPETPFSRSVFSIM